MPGQFSVAFHPDARQTFDARAKSLLQDLAPAPAMPGHASFIPDIFPTLHLTEKDIIEVKHTGLSDTTGREKARFFRHNDESIGLVEDSFEKLVELAEDIQRTPSLRSSASVHFLTDTIFEWVKMRFQHRTAAELTEYVAEQCEKKVEEQELWIPVFRLHVESPFRVGKVEITTISKALLDDHLGRISSRLSQENAEPWRIQQLLHRERKELQGLAAASIRLVAEPLRAEEVAYQEADTAISILRFFHPANLNPEMPCFCTLLGSENVKTMTCLHMKDGGIAGKAQKLLHQGPTSWKIGKNHLQEIRKGGLDTLSRVLVEEKKSDFARDVLEALTLYTRSTLLPDPLDKLVYIFASLESILLRGKNEPIQQNIGERMAFLIGKTAEERLAIGKNVKLAYDFRSRFVHHGHRVQDLAPLRSFMEYAWRTHFAFVDNIRRFNTRQELVDLLEKRKME